MMMNISGLELIGSKVVLNKDLVKDLVEGREKNSGLFTITFTIKGETVIFRDKSEYVCKRKLAHWGEHEHHKYKEYEAPDGTKGPYKYFEKEAEHGHLHGTTLVF